MLLGSDNTAVDFIKLMTVTYQGKHGHTCTYLPAQVTVRTEKIRRNGITIGIMIHFAWSEQMEYLDLMPYQNGLPIDIHRVYT